MSERRTVEAIISGWARENGIAAPTDLLIEAIEENIDAALGSGPARREIYDAIDKERARMEAKWGPNTCASRTLPIADKMAVLAEEAGEVATEVNDLREIPNAWTAAAREQERERLTDRLRTELVQTAAVAVAWLESL